MQPEQEKYKYEYNGKEFQGEFSLNWNDYGARNYDASLGRWVNLDALAEKYYSLSLYCYAANTPVKVSDPNGKSLFLHTNEMKDIFNFINNFLNSKNEISGSLELKIVRDKKGNLKGMNIFSYKPSNKNLLSKHLANVVNSKEVVNVILQKDDPVKIEAAEHYHGALFSVSKTKEMDIFVMKKYLRNNYYYAAYYNYYKKSHSFFKDDKWLKRNIPFFEGFMHEIIHASRYLNNKTLGYPDEENEVIKIMNNYRRKNGLIERGYIRTASFWESLWGSPYITDDKTVD